MKHTKRMLAIIMTLMMVLSMTIAMSATAFAADPDPDYDYPLTVTGLAEGDTVQFYKVIEWVGYTEDKSDVSGWKAVSPYSTVLDKETLTAMLVGDPKADPAVAPTGMTSEIAGKLAKLATGGVPATSISDGTATLNNASSGMWMALVTPADAKTLYNPVFVSADYNKETGHEGTAAVTGAYADAVAKSSTLTLTKEASTSPEDSWDDKKPNTTAVGDTVTFTVNTAIPAYGDVYTNPHFAIKDTLTALALNTDSVTVTVPAGLEKEKDYTVSATAAGYTLTFSETYLKKVKAATPVEVTYSAVVTSDAAFAVNEEDNEVYIEYSHDPSDQDDYDVQKDTTQHYTFSLDASGIAAGESEVIHGKKTSEVVKVGVDAAGNPITETVETSEIGDPEVDKWEGPLAEALFGLFTDAAGNTPLKDKDGKDVTATTGADGRMNFAGLDAGTYYLKEISAPAGYVTDPAAYPVVIAAEFETVTVTEWWNGTAWVSEKPASGTAKEVTYETEILKKYTVTINGQLAAEYTFTNDTEVTSTEIQWENAELVEHPFEIENTQGTELPSTGGIGTIIFYVVGTILVLGCGIVLISKRRLNANK